MNYVFVREYMLYKYCMLVGFLLVISTMNFTYNIDALSGLPNQAVIHAILEGNAPGTLLEKKSRGRHYILLKSA